jgi:hypothetical protein
MPPKKTPSPASTAGPPAKKAKVAASAEAPARVATRSRAARGPAGGTTTLPAPTAGDGGAVPTNHVASLDSLPQAVRVGLAAELAQALATQVKHTTAQMLADQGKVNAAMMASHAQMQAKMSELARAQRAQDKPLTQPAPPAPATEIFKPADVILRRRDGARGVVVLATPGAAAGTAPVSYCVYMDGDTHTITLDAACLSRFTGPKKTPPGQAASAAAAALDGWVHHITLTGAPGAGKTATIDVLADAIRATGKYHVVTKPEVPTQVFASVGGFKKDWAGNAPLLLYLQSEIMRRQLQMDFDAYQAARMAHATDKKPCIIIGDRCVKDGEAFASAEDWATTCKANKMEPARLARDIGLVLMLDES